jgi:hypothetical protein
MSRWAQIVDLMKAGGGRTAPDPDARIVRSPDSAESLPVYFEFNLQSEKQIGASSLGLLSPGKDYIATLRLTYGTGLTNAARPNFKLLGEFLSLNLVFRGYEEEFDISLSPDSPCGSEDEDGRIHVFRQELLAKACQIHFRFRLPLNCPLLETDLYVDCCEPQFISDHRFEAPKIPVLLQGRALSAEDSQRLNILPGIPIPRNWAMLHVTEPRSKLLKLSGWHSRSPLSGITELKIPQYFDLTEWLEKSASAEWILQKIREFSNQTVPPELSSWLENVLQSPSDNAVIFIVEHTKTAVPWELLSFDVEYLGTRSEVVRWINIPKRKLNIEKEKHHGSVTSFFADEIKKKGRPELAELEKVGHVQLPNRDEFLNVLDKNLSKIGLIYLGYHAILSDREGAPYWVLKSPGNPSQNVNDMKLQSLRWHDEGLPVWIINACHSARLIRESEEENDETPQLIGLPKDFLSFVARAYIGTLGQVRDPYASEIGAQILQKIRESSNGASLSQILRDLRSEIAEDFRLLGSSQDEQERFLYTFMYVFYGNPRLRLSVEPAPTNQKRGK